MEIQDSPARTYTVKRIVNDFPIDGMGSHSGWQDVESLNDFSFPWENEPLPSLSFKALHTMDWLYCLFTVMDTNINAFVDKGDKREVINSDRVELFMRKSEKMIPYYCLELDPLGRVLDYKAEYYRRFDMNWSWPIDQLKVKASRSQSGYSVEVAIGKKSLMELGLLSNQQIEAGIFRGKCMEIREGEANLKWISWVTPDSKNPDFHIPSSFGVLVLEN
jgi:Carbohydrate family 9 binding domain-like